MIFIVLSITKKSKLYLALHTSASHNEAPYWQLLLCNQPTLLVNVRSCTVAISRKRPCDNQSSSSSSQQQQLQSSSSLP